MKKKGKIAKKLRRYSNMMSEVENWPQFLWFKTFNPAPEFNFKIRNSFEIKVNKRMFSPFKEIFFDQVYLNEITRKHLKKPEPVIIDVGANVGFFSLFMCAKFPRARIYAFEPMPFNFNVLQNHKQQYPQFNITPVNKAVSGSTEPLVLNASSLDSFTTMSGIFKSGKRTETIEIPSTTLEEVMTANKLDVVDFLKLDCEGSEYSILYSAGNELLRRVRIMSIEVHQGNDPNENYESLSEFLDKAGFNLTGYKDKQVGYIWAWRKE